MKNTTEEESRVVNITTWCKVNSSLKSEYGDTTYEVWCEKEVERIRNSGGAAELARKGELICVVRPAKEVREN